MDSVREWAAAVCCSCMLGAMLSLISPGGSVKRHLSTVISLMTVCVLLRPFLSWSEWFSELGRFSFEPSVSENQTLEEEITRNAEGIYASYLKENIGRLLDGEGISYKSIEVMMDNSQDGCISIERVEVIIKNEDVDKSYRIKRLLRDTLGFEPTVTAADALTD